VIRLDRLDRSQRDLVNVADEIEEAGANLKVSEQAVDTSTAADRAFFGMLAVFAAFETDVRRERHGGKARLDRARVKQLADEASGRRGVR